LITTDQHRISENTENPRGIPRKIECRNFSYKIDSNFFFGKFFFGGHDRITSMLAEELSAKAVEEEFNRIGF
jgi:hypothetical protein